MTIGDRIRAVRKSKDLTQKELAKRLGISDVCVAQWECHKRNPTSDSLKKIANGLEVSVEYLLGETNDTSVLKQLEIGTTIGTLVVENRNEDMWKSVKVSLKLPNGELIPLSNTAVTNRCNDIVMELWQNPASDVPEYRYCLPKEKLVKEGFLSNE